jgi:hypothetical protein
MNNTSIYIIIGDSQCDESINLIHEEVHVHCCGGGARTMYYCHARQAQGGGAKENGMSPFLNKTGFPNGTYYVFTMQVNGEGM